MAISSANPLFPSPVKDTSLKTIEGGVKKKGAIEKVKDDWHALVPMSLSLLDERDKPPIVQAFSYTWRNYERRNVVLKVIKEEIANSGRFTYNAYMNVMPTSPAIRIDNAPSMPEIVAVYRKYLLVRDAKISTSLGKKAEAPIMIDDVPEEEEARERALLRASTENVRQFATGVNRSLFGAVNPEDMSRGGGAAGGEGNSSDLFYTATLYLRQPPMIMQIPLLANRDLGYDVMTVTGRAIKKEMGNIFRLRNYLRRAREIFGPNSLAAKKEATTEKMIHDLDMDIVNMHRVSATYTFYARDIETLEKKIRDFNRTMRMYGIQTEWLNNVQDILYEKGMPAPRHAKSAYVPTNTFMLFYPFKSAEILEQGSPMSVYVGTNRQTGSPVFIDIARHLNKNMTLVGMPRAGKSMWIKLLIVRLNDAILSSQGQNNNNNNNDSRPAMVVIDPSSTQEYAPLAAQLEIPYRSLREGAGIDPIREFDAPTAASILSELFEFVRQEADFLLGVIELFKEKAPAPHTIDKLPAFAEAHGHEIAGIDQKRVSDLVIALRSGLSKYGHIFKGNRPEGSFALSVYTLDEKAKVAACTMAMSYAIKHFHALPASRLKMFVLDEGWSILSSPTASAKFSYLSRDMGKHNTSVIFITQDPSDVADKEAGAVHIKNSSFKFLFKNDGIKTLQDLLSLSDTAIDQIRPSKVAIKPGMMLCMIDDVQALVKVDATEEESARFNTSPEVQ